MDKKEVLNFVYEVIKDENLQIYPIVKYKYKHISYPCEIILFKGKDKKNLLICNLILNRNVFNNKTNRNLLKAYILHEFGHCFFESKSKYKNELYAQTWAIYKARKMGIKFIERHLITIMKEWLEMNWQDFEFRRYITAAKEYFKEKK